MTEQTKKLHTVDGRVVSNKMDKTVTVLVEPESKPIYPVALFKTPPL